MLDALAEAFADEQHYAPLAAIADPGPRFAPSRVPAGWCRTDQEITRMSCLREAGLHAGLAGPAYFLADHAELAGGETRRHNAVRTATGLLKYAIPHTHGALFLGKGSHRFSADLYQRRGRGADWHCTASCTLRVTSCSPWTARRSPRCRCHDVRTPESPHTERAGDRI